MIQRSSQRPRRGLLPAGIAIVVVAVVLVAVANLGGGGSPTTALGPTSATSNDSGSTGGAGSPEASGSTTTPIPSTSPIFAGGLLVADRGNGRILVLSQQGAVLWRFPASKAAIPAGQAFSADDAFIDPNGKTIVANDEFHEVIDRIDIATGRIVWQYGRYGTPGAGPGQLHTPDDAYPLANGDITVADIMNCRVLEIAPDKSIVRQWGKTGVCHDEAGVTYGLPNGDTPLPDGGLLITEITGSRVVRLAADGHVVFDIHVPVRYPSDAQLDAKGNIIVADFSTHGQVVAVDPTGKLVWRYAPTSGPGALNHPSLATPLADGLVVINDDFRDRMIVIDPTTGALVWQYGHAGRVGTGPGYLNTPDGHQPLPPGIFVSPAPSPSASP
ncbi:MAG TPA: PQQ-binding-like beta-propeller repeat protein [Candidatus Limnocylindrales bacterium]|nr:PQQ-binding-like beta-propeller repeat protein [Candidatus Limnocylindrales bacterium]